jgi:hypothetical protein
MKFGTLVDGCARRPWREFHVDWPKGSTLANRRRQYMMPKVCCRDLIVYCTLYGLNSQELADLFIHYY